MSDLYATMTARPLRVLDLFAGIGGFSLGLERTGRFETVGFCEIDPYASKVLKQWWPNVPNEQRGILALNALLRRARTSSPPASRARTSLSPGAAPDLPAPVRDSSGLSYEPFAWFDRKARCWRTWQRCFIEGWEIFSGDWPRSGMTRNGIAFRRQPLAPLTAATDYGSLLPTPEASNAKATALRSQGRSPRNFLAPLPTPTAMDARGSRNCTSGRSNPNSKHHDGMTLNDFVRLWPTPRASDGEKGGQVTAAKSREGGTLTEAVSARENWPTPTARDWRSPARSESAWEQRQNDQVGGALNPDWVEWLMGFPIGHTDLDAPARREALGWGVEPDLPRAAAGVPKRVGRLRCLGNAVVPQVVEAIARAMMKSENE